MQAKMTTARAWECDLDEYSDYAGPVCVWKTWRFFEHTFNAPADGFVLDDDIYDQRPCVFGSVSEALDWIEKETAGAYHLSAGEYAPPTYYIVPAEMAE